MQDTLTWNESSAEADRDGEDGSDTEDDTAVEDTEEEREVLELPDSLGKDFFVTQDDIYVADQLSYTVTAQHIEVPNQRKDGFEEYDVSYPVITYADGRDATGVNEILRNAACAQLDTMYPEPQEEYLYLDEDYPYLACYVDYEITYMSDEILCVAFQDHYFNGSMWGEFCDRAQESSILPRQSDMRLRMCCVRMIRLRRLIMKKSARSRILSTMHPHLPPGWRDRRWTGRFWREDITATMSSAKMIFM